MKGIDRLLIESRVFGVCSYLGDKMGVASRRVRLYFIYSSFITFGSPVIIYLVAAFWLNVRAYVRHRILSVWDA